MSTWYDLRLAVRSLLRNPGFSLIVVLTMAVGIGANVAVFIYLSYFLWPTMDAPRPEELVRIETAFEKSSADSNSYLDWLDLKRENRVFRQLAGYRLLGVAVKDKERTQFAWGHAVSGDYFSIFGALPEYGRLIQSSDDRPESERVIVFNHLFWTQHFGADPSVIGKTVFLNGHEPYTVIGVTRPGFQGQGIATEIYVPLATAAPILTGLDKRQNRRIESLGRLNPGISVAQAQAALAPMGSNLNRLYPEEQPRHFELKPVSEAQAWTDEDPLVLAAKILMAAVALLLLLACANVANLLLARTQTRRQEIAILAAIGAGRAYIARRLLIESLLLSLTGGMLGLLLGYWAKEIIEYYLLHGTPVGMGTWGQATNLVVNERLVIFYVFGISLLTGLLFGLAPVIQTLRTDLVTALKSNIAGTGKRAFEMRKVLVVVQVALSIVLLLGAGLLVRTLSLAKNQGTGFETRNLMLASVYMPAARTSDEAQSKAAYKDLLERLRALPGVESASLVQVIPLTGFIYKVELQLAQQTEKQTVNVNVVAPAYFETLKIPISRGRSFEDRDGADSPRVGVINQTAARQLWPDQDPIGQRILLVGDAGKMEPCEVVGVVADSQYERIIDPVRPQIYFTYQQQFRPRMTFVVRASAPIGSGIREVLRRNYPDLAVIDLLPFTEQIRRSLMDQRMNADIAISFGFVGLVLAAMGIFSVMSYTVSRRRREFGVRMAVGATSRDISRLVLKEAGRLIAVGVFVGLAAALALGKIITSILYRVSPHDPYTFSAVLLALAAVALLAAWLPALRASRVDPLKALRDE